MSRSTSRQSLSNDGLLSGRLHVEALCQCGLVGRLLVGSARSFAAEPLLGSPYRLRIPWRFEHVREASLSRKRWGCRQEPCLILAIGQHKCDSPVWACHQSAIQQLRASSAGQSSSASINTSTPPTLATRSPCVLTTSSKPPGRTSVCRPTRYGLGTFIYKPGAMSATIRRSSTGTASTSPCPSTTVAIVTIVTTAPPRQQRLG
jgi:hypothetical protein